MASQVIKIQNMRTLIYVLFIIFCTFQNISSQQLVSATYKGARTKAQIAALFNLPLIKYGVKYYRITYTSSDAKGMLDTLSGLLVVPDDVRYEYPRLVYQHGTSDCKKCVPSNYGAAGADEGQLGLLFAGLGFVSMLPDYVGMGDGRGFQTYVHASTIVSATTDMLNACNSWAGQNNVFTNDQLFITGYSQGGYASMALHKFMEESFGAASVTAASHMSGPYSLSGVMRDLILIDSAYNYPAYIPNTVLGFNEANNNLYTTLDDFFKTEYTADIKRYYDGIITLTTLNTKLIQLLKNNTGAAVAGRMIRDDVKAAIAADPQHIVNRLLKENDLFNWAPKAPTKILYCKADDQVPYKNSVVAKNFMLANGATNLEVTDVNSNANHSTCFTPAITQTVLFFLGLQKIATSTISADIKNKLLIFPNPANNLITLDGLYGGNKIEIFDVFGHVVKVEALEDTISTQIDISGMPEGLYSVKISTREGISVVEKFVKVY